MKASYAVVFGIAALLLLGLVWQGPPPLPEGVAPTAVPVGDDLLANAYPLFPFLAGPQDITAMALEIPAEGTTYAYVTQTDNPQQWTLREPPYTPLEHDLANVIRQNLMRMPGLGAFERGELTPESLGFLPNLQYVISFQVVPDAEGVRTITVYIGDRTRSGQAYYAAPALQEGVVDLVPADWIDRFVDAMQNLHPERQAGEDIPSPSP